MRIGIITYHRAENYGSVLQAYALNKYIRDLNKQYEVETIDYYNQAQMEMYTLFQPNTCIMNIVRNIHTLLNKHALLQKKASFQKFIEQYIPLSINFKNNQEELTRYADNYTICICGSDQIWNTHCQDQDSNYFLSFATQSYKIAYAPSLGITQFTPEDESIFKKYLPTFNALSVREKIGADYLQKLIHKPITVVADPVFLLERKQWEAIANPSSYKKKYILCYFIGDIPGMRDFAKKVEKETGYRAIVILKNLRDIKYHFYTLYSTGPQDFLGLIKDAEYIITSSFHAVAFSIIFNKKFWVFTGNNKKPNSRITNICNICNLENRILTTESWQNCLYDAPIDFISVNKNIEYYKQYSAQFIIDSIHKNNIQNTK